MNKKIINSLAVLLFIVIKMKAQDPTFSQFNSVPLYFNPGFAGSVEKSRLALSYRNQWSSTYKTFYFSYDQAVKSIHGGAGLIVINDNSGSLNASYIGLVYAPKFNILDKIAISPAVKIGYRQESIDQSNLTFGDMIDARRGFVYSSANETMFKVSNTIDLSAGLVINTENIYAGFAADHINEPNISVLTGGKSPLPRKYTGQLGYTFQKNEKSNFSISPSILYQQQASFHLFQTNLSCRYKWAVIGAGVTSAVSCTGMLGYYGNRLIIGYSYDYYLSSSLTQAIQTLFIAHEVSIKYLFTLKRKKKESANS